MDAFAEQLNQIYALTCAIFRDNFLYTPISPAAFSSLYAGIEQLVDPDLVRFATDARGELVGFVFAMPDWQETLCARRRGATAAAPATINIKTLGVLPRVRGSGLAPALMHGVYAEAAARGMKAVNLCLIREGNPSGRLEGGYGRRLREYILYGLEA